MRPTPEQEAILRAGDVDIAVSAGAGSGKTHVLVERYVGLLDDCEVPRIAAVTFTEAAAAEMRDRVRREVMERPELARHRAHLDEAVIGTIHSLCLRLLRDHPVEAAIDPAASVLPQDEAELLLQEACRSAVDDAAEHAAAGDARTGALRALSAYWVERLLPSLVASRDDVRRAFTAMGPVETWPDYVRDCIDRESGEDASRYQEAASIAMAEVRDLHLAIEGKLRAVVDAVVAAMPDKDVSPGDAGWSELAGRAAALVNLQSGKRDPASLDMQIKDSMRVLREAMAELAKVPAWNEHDAPALDALAGLQRLFEDACARYEVSKRDRHALDFLDLEIGAVRLLREHPAVAAATRARFRHVMVDEAQDVSPIQAEFIRLLLGDGGTPSDGARPWLFLVGDVKQSIYRFRGADVTQFNALQAEVRGRGGQVLPLTRSFRTHDELVERFNELFEAIFGEPDGDHVAPMERLRGRGDSPPGAHLVLMPVARGGREVTQYQRRRREAALVAEEIARLLDEATPVWDKRAGAYAPVRPRDIAILLRGFPNVHIYEQALEERGIPYATPSGTGFFTRQEVRDLSNLLRWLAEPEDQIALAGALRSPMFAIADDTLLTLAEAGRTLWTGLRAVASSPEDGLPLADHHSIRHAADVLGGLRTLASRATADEVLEHALHETAVEATWAVQAGGEQAIANIQKLRRMVRALAGYSIAEVVDYLEARRDDLATREGPAVLDRPDAVQVMTVHGAKGLEFPVVFVPEGQVETVNSWDAIRWRPDDGISVSLVALEDDIRRRRPGFYSYLQQRDHRADTAEHARLFYVAATRAADRLYLSGDEGVRGWLGDALNARDEGVLSGVETRPTASVGDDFDRRPRLSRRARSSPPPEGTETPYTSPLADRPTVIPLRSSTPVTALKPPSTHATAAAAAGDGLGTLRGNIAHRAIEATFRGGARPDLLELAREESERALDPETLGQVVEEVTEILDRFEASTVAGEIRAAGERAWFELPFAWDWDGIPIHGSIDLVYQDAAGHWHVIDFKTDRVGPGGTAAVAERYIVQVGLYGRALEAATGVRPALGLLFLRTGERVTPTEQEVDLALATARERVDAAALVDTDEPEYTEVLEDAI